MSVARERKPVICAAYGADGLQWLRALRRRCLDIDGVAALVERRVIQFWHIGAPAGSVEGISSWATAPALPIASSLLDEARSARVQAEIPGLRVRRILVLERASLFGTELPEARKRLRDTLEGVPEFAAPDAAGRPGFSYEWIALADAIHDPAQIGDAERDAARANAVSNGRDALTFLVDRLDTNTAVQDLELASRCLMELAVAFISSDIGAPRQDGVSVAVPMVLQRTEESSVVPFGVSVLRHSRDTVMDVRVRALWCELSRGELDQSRAEGTLGSPGALLTCIRDEITGLETPGFDQFARRRAREQVAADMMAWAMLTGTSSVARDVLARIQLEIPRLYVSHEVDARAIVPAPIALLATAAGSPDMSIVLGGAAVLIAGVGFLAYRRFSAAEAKSVATATAGGASEVLRQDVAAEWQNLSERLLKALDVIDARLQSALRPASVSRMHAAWTAEPPISQAFQMQGLIDHERVEISPELCRNIGRQIVREWGDPQRLDRIVTDACEREIERLDERRAGVVGTTTLARALGRALEPDNVAPLRQFLDGRPYLVSPTIPPMREAVIWIAAPSLNLGPSLLALESAASRDATVVLSHDDETKTIRLQLARPTAWNSVPTFSAVSSDGN